MTDKEFVLSIYPDAVVDPNYLAGYSVFRLTADNGYSVTSGNDEAGVWKRLRGSVEAEMLRKLAS